MEQARVTVIILLCVLFCEHQRVFGTEVDVRVKTGDNITLYGDCVIPLGSHIVWLRNCSHEHQPSLLIETINLFRGMFPRFSFVFNSSSNSYDLHIVNVSVSDEGKYYCAIDERKIHGVMGSLYKNGNRRTCLSVLEAVSFSDSTTSSPISESDCVLCWTLLFSVCPVCVLLSSHLSYCLCQRKTAGSEMSAEILKANVLQADSVKKHQCEMSKTGKICLHTEVSYRLLTSEHPYAKM
ncbi:uncharacterized protein LOC125273156 [Megalobrama amblycephala]|uniref:uncharacterized protein LOC125273156 n=1 Tax=Megalobrama amblycephala TaxID=75352 RepID=UPI00201417B5|nr:uncharacterized protein LOC125273156 [Megalobrama amblycephala]